MRTGTSSLMDSHLVDFSNKNANNIKSNTTVSTKEFDEFMDNVKAIQQDPFTQFNMYEHKETVASSDTPQNPLSKLTWEEAFKIYGEHQIQMLEISDEEIEEASRQINYGGGSEGWIKDAFRNGAKWYREQLKKKQ